jgi:hypothetical protein
MVFKFKTKLGRAKKENLGAGQDFLKMQLVK